MKTICSIIFMTVLFSSCHSQQNQIDFFNKNLINLKNNATYLEVKKQSYDSLNSWIKDGVQANGIPILKTEVEFRFDDAIFFNQKKNRCILMILERDTRAEAKLDNIQLMFGNLEDNRWYFYIQSLPTIFFSREVYNNYSPLNFSQLSTLGRALLIKEYYHKYSLKINDAFFDYDINQLKQLQVEFLNDK